MAPNKQAEPLVYTVLVIQKGLLPVDVLYRDHAGRWFAMPQGVAASEAKLIRLSWSALLAVEPSLRPYSRLAPGCGVRRRGVGAESDSEGEDDHEAAATAWKEYQLPQPQVDDGSAARHEQAVEELSQRARQHGDCLALYLLVTGVPALMALGFFALREGGVPQAEDFELPLAVAVSNDFGLLAGLAGLLALLGIIVSCGGWATPGLVAVLALLASAGHLLEWQLPQHLTLLPLLLAGLALVLCLRSVRLFVCRRRLGRLRRQVG